MDAFAILGFIFGMSAMGTAGSAMSKLGGLRKEVEALKKQLEDSGVLERQPEAKGE